MTDSQTDYSRISGEDPEASYIAQIGFGTYSEVHEVNRPSARWLILDAQQYKQSGNSQSGHELTE
jgi:hypothetical protein